MVNTGKPAAAGHGPAAAGSDPHRHLTTLQGWRDFTLAAPAPPALLPGARYAALDEDAAAPYHDERLDYHTRRGVVAHLDVAAGRHYRAPPDAAEPAAVSARQGLILSGAARHREDPPRSPVRQDPPGHRPRPPPRAGPHPA